MDGNLKIGQGFYNRKSGGGSAYNYELAPLIDNFTFYDFINNTKKNKRNLQENGGFLIITNNQYIIGYTAGFGVGTHLSAFSRAMKDMMGGGDIHNLKDAITLDSLCSKNYITARIVYEYLFDDEHGRPRYNGTLNFMLSGLEYKITPEQFEVFKEFYNDYNEDIEYVTTKCGLDNFCVRYGYLDSDGNTKYNVSGNLDMFYNYLSKNIDDFKEIIEEEKIIGKEKHRTDPSRSN